MGQPHALRPVLYETKQLSYQPFTAKLQRSTQPQQAHTPLQVAAAQGRLDIVAALLRAGADPNIARAGDGATPLALAAERGDGELCRVLLTRGAAVDQTADRLGSTALHLAAGQGCASGLSSEAESD